jgi:hypothetical protein
MLLNKSAITASDDSTYVPTSVIAAIGSCLAVYIHLSSPR